MNINGFNATVLNETKVLYVQPTDCTLDGISIPLEGRATKAKITAAADSAPFEVKSVNLHWHRYCTYRLRFVMKERSGDYAVFQSWKLTDGEWVTEGRKIENSMY